MKKGDRKGEKKEDCKCLDRENRERGIFFALPSLSSNSRQLLACWRGIRMGV